MTNITINATSNSEWSTVNTDGTDTWNSDNIYLEKWVVTNGQALSLFIIITPWLKLS